MDVFDFSINGDWLYAKTAAEFLRDARVGVVFDQVNEAYIELTGEDASVNERNAWRDQSDALAHLMKISGITRQQIIILEYLVPPKSLIELAPPSRMKRIDVVFGGTSKHGNNYATILEMKLWNMEHPKIELSEYPFMLKTKYRGEKRMKHAVHPSVQAAAYGGHIRDLSTELELPSRMKVRSYAYLPNCDQLNGTPRGAVLCHQQFKGVRKENVLYTKSYEGRLKNRLHAQLAYGDGFAVLENLSELQEQAYAKIDRLLEGKNGIGIIS